jgi:hypothetical protein
MSLSTILLNFVCSALDAKHFNVMTTLRLLYDVEQ